MFFAGVLATLFLGWAALIGVPSIQLRSIPPQPGLRPYTYQQAHGREIFIREGCVYCHTQQTRPPGFGGDQGRRWGRPSVPGDYAYDQPHLLGTSRTGPDLLNIAARQPAPDWHFAHLFNPRMLAPKSVMPPFPWLFEARTSTGPEDVVVDVAPTFRTGPGTFVPTIEGRDLVEFLLAMNHTYPVAALIPAPDGRGSGQTVRP
ncbi:MAG: cbb3-type cytochrome c oxidase subunit II [Acidobacteriia bacterium]|nr:cbb3-type cytochrome c oxidase subunit II [Terriglobia bacterium]